MKTFTISKQEDNLNDFIFESTVADKNVCNYLIDQYHMMEHHEGRVSRDGDENYVNTNMKVAEQTFVEPNNPCYQTIYECIDKTISSLPYGLTIPYDIKSTEYSIRRYPKGEGHFGTHVDTLSKVTYNRLLAFILYLNDVEEGGETEFMTLNRLVKPETGKVLCFPCNFMFPHKGNIPLSNDKYIVTAFVYPTW